MIAKTNTTTTVLKNVAASELIPETPTLANTAVSAANDADNNAQIIHA